MQLGGNLRWVPLQTGKGKHSFPELLCLICSEPRPRDQETTGFRDEKEQHFANCFMTFIALECKLSSSVAVVLQSKSTEM